MLVMIEQQGVFWARSVYEPPTLPVFYVVSLSRQTMKWQAHPSRSSPSGIAIYTLSG
jgi:hypothetical protein